MELLHKVSCQQTNHAWATLTAVAYNIKQINDTYTTMIISNQNTEQEITHIITLKGTQGDWQLTIGRQTEWTMTAYTELGKKAKTMYNGCKKSVE